MTRPAVAFALAAVAGCTPHTPFAGPGWDGALTTDAEGPFVAAITHTRPADGMGGAFDAHVDAITAQMDESDGCIGYSLRGRVPGRERWTVSVWASEEDLLAFVTTGAHADAMAEAGTVIEGVWSTTYPVEAADLPPAWDIALDHLAEVEPDDTF